MTDFDNTDKGALFKNKDKTEQTAHFSDYHGTINVNGKEYWINAWLKKSKKNVSYMSLAVSPKEKATGQSQHQKPERETGPDGFEDSDIPF